MSEVRINISGWTGSKEELMQQLMKGLHINGMQHIGSSWIIDFETEPKVGRPASIDKEQIFSMRAAGMSYAAIGKKLGCSKTYIIKVCKQQEKTDSEALQNPSKEIEPVETAEPKAAIHPSGSSPAVDSAADTDEIPGQMRVEDFLQPIELNLGEQNAPKIPSPKKSLKELRKASGLTQKQLAEATGLKLSEIKDYENGKNGMKFVGPVIRHVLAKALHCRVDDFEDYYFDI